MFDIIECRDDGDGSACEAYSRNMRVLVLGGYGSFGARICRALDDDGRFEVVVAGRDPARTQTMADTLRNARPLAIDHRNPAFANVLEQSCIELVVHAAGPFQSQSYDVARATARAGAHYIDLADGRRFVCDFAKAVGEAFAAAGRVAISGASTVPALSSAVVDALCKRWQRIDAIDSCIAPAQSAPRGVATLAGVLSYCGADIDVWSDGRWQRLPAWCNPRPVTFHRLESRRGAICDVPDLELFPAHYAVAERVTLRAALEVPPAQQVLALIGNLRRKGWIKHPQRCAAALARAGALLDLFGSQLGGMYVRVTGIDGNGSPRRLAWHVAADHNHGPAIPAMPAVLLARRLYEGRAAAPGAYACVGMLTLAEFLPEFARWGMLTDIIEETKT
jgi:saccharopine dehydrogenase-like NADP-dependent oxidoreductase